jgi:hypothetical protein
MVMTVTQSPSPHHLAIRPPFKMCKCTEHLTPHSIQQNAAQVENVSKHDHVTELHVPDRHRPQRREHSHTSDVPFSHSTNSTANGPLYLLTYSMEQRPS